MEGKHTEGEWFISGFTEIIAMPSQTKICKVYPVSLSDHNKGNHEMIANARLIASSKELLYALQTVRHRIETGLIHARIKDVEMIDKALNKTSKGLT